MSPGRVVDYPLGLRSQGPEFKSPSGRFRTHQTTSVGGSCACIQLKENPTSGVILQRLLLGPTVGTLPRRPPWTHQLIVFKTLYVDNSVTAFTFKCVLLWGPILRISFTVVAIIFVRIVTKQSHLESTAIRRAHNLDTSPLSHHYLEVLHLFLGLALFFYHI